MKDKQFYDIDMAQRYLSESVITLAGEPALIIDVEGRGVKDGWKVHTRLLSDPDCGRVIYLPNDDIDMNPVELGMSNYRSFDHYQAFIIQRAPVRAWKVGLARNNMRTLSLRRGGQAPVNGRDLLLSSSLRDTVLGQYPTYEEAKALLSDETSSCAFSRRFAVSGDGNLYHTMATDAVGIHEGGGEPVLSNDYLYLHEVLEEDLKHGA
jgi:hypothetical protein